LEEVLEAEPGRGAKPNSYYSFIEGKASIKIALPGKKRRLDQVLDSADVGPERSVLSERKGKNVYPELTAVGAALSGITLFRDCNFGQETVVRLPQRTDLPGDFLLEDASNLALVINHLESNPTVKKLLLEKLRVVYENASDLTTKVDGGTIQLLLHESGLRSPVPATRLSDGTLRYLCLLAILLHPEPPPLVCLEEPELGLHPDIIPKVADLLVAASQRTQLIVTTHSESLISRLSEIPESIVVCERDDRGTQLRRLDPAQMKGWLERYLLGELWAMGEIGGNRW